MPFPSTRVVHCDRTSTVADTLADTKPTCGTIKRRIMTKSGAGGDAETLRTIATDVAYRARVQGRRAVAGETGDETTETERWELSFAPGTNVRAGDRFIGEGRTWDILSAGAESYEPELRALAAEVTD